MPSALPEIVQRTLVVVLALGLLGALGAAAPLSGEAPLDNTPEDGREAYQGRQDLDPGQIETDAESGDDDFDRVDFGVRGGGTLFGWTDLDGDDRESELIVRDPTLSPDDVRFADAENDGDPEVVWIGTAGSDVDGNGTVILEEAGAIVALIDVDGDDRPEIIVEDTSRVIGDFHADGFNINRSVEDDLEVLWVGVLGEGGRGRAAKIVSFGDVNNDGESEVELQDIRTSGSPPFDQFIDVDGDGDADIVLRVSDA